MVAPDYQRMGLATRVVNQCINLVPNTTIMLVATDEGVNLYKKLGFQMVSTLSKMVAQK